jgi:hypothetical protein
MMRSPQDAFLPDPAALHVAVLRQHYRATARHLRRVQAALDRYSEHHAAAAMPPEYRALLPPLPRRPVLSEAALRALHATLLGRLQELDELGTALVAGRRN